MINLYNYQERYIEALRSTIKQGNRRVILCAPTGSGKTIMFSYMVAQAVKKKKKVIVFTHRSELLNQAGGTFAKFGIEAEPIQAGKNPNLLAQVHVAMVETFNRRKIQYYDLLQSKDLVIFDEAHLQNFNKVLPLINSKSIVIGATATPERKPKDVQLIDFYQDIVQVMDTPDVIEMGKLVPAKYYGVDIPTKGMKKTAHDYDTSSYYEENKTYKGVVKNWEKHTPNTKTILFASNIESSKDVCQEFVSKGYDARHIDGKMGKKARNEVLDWFASTDNGILCNCGILTAGYDEPSIKTVILYRATTSLPLYLQMCGRGSRLHPGKDHFTILDFGNNVSRHNYWHVRREWKLDNSKKANKEDAMPMKICPDCDSIVRASASNCEICGFEFPKPEPTEEEIMLRELREVESKGKKLSELSLEDLIRIENAKKYKSAYIWRVVRSRGIEAVRDYAELKGHSSGWVSRQHSEILKGNCTFFDKIV